MTHSFKHGACMLLLLAFTGCVKPTGSQIDRHAVKIPETFGGEGTSASTFADGWLEAFEDRSLPSLIQEALERNHDLSAASARLAAARASFQAANAGWKPVLNLNQSNARSKTVFNPFAGELQSRYINRFDLGMNLSWELDLWGRLRHQGRAALADLQATRADYKAAYLSIAASTASAWFNAIESELQVQLTKETLESFEANLQVVDESYRRGIPNRALDLRLTRANVHNARSNLALRMRQRDQAKRAMETLLGRYPSANLDLMPQLPQMQGAIPLGLPSELLRRRPDVLAAERRLAAAAERLQLSRKNLLPGIRLTSSIGTTSNELTELLDPERMALSIANSLTQPLYQGGRLRAGVRLSDARLQESMAQFSKTILTAFREVETLLASEGFLKVQERAQEASVTESMEAEILAKEQYEKGLVDIITVLESERRAFTARSSLLSLSNLRLQNRIDLYLAIGGHFSAKGWQAETNQTSD
ncbi:MAG: TolC family protein [Verrucomicrobiota bacterium]|nr:TolC family protein [Verrucomicrobiota bacterium]